VSLTNTRGELVLDLTSPIVTALALMLLAVLALAER